MNLTEKDILSLLINMIEKGAMKEDIEKVIKYAKDFLKAENTYKYLNIDHLHNAYGIIITED